MLKFTLDTNCVIALDEEREPEVGPLRRLLEAHTAGEVCLRLVACTASENQPGGAPPLGNFALFRERLRRQGLDHLEVLPAPATLGLAYLDHMMLGGDDDGPLLESLHAVLFPAWPFARQDALRAAPPGTSPEKAARDWRNRRLDVEALWCHLRHGGDVFVTTDKGFLRKRSQLAAFGASVICDPGEAEAYVRQQDSRR